MRPGSLKRGRGARGRVLGLAWAGMAGLCLGDMAAQAATLFATASVGPTGQSGGVVASGGQYVGFVFTLEDRAQLTALGAHITAGPTGGSIWAAIAEATESAPSMEASQLLSQALFTTLWTPPSPSADARVSVDLVLNPGTYALVLGGNALGSTGYARLPTVGVETPDARYFNSVAQGPWQVDAYSGVRFVIEGELLPPIPLPGAGPLSLALLGLVALACGRRTASARGV